MYRLPTQFDASASRQDLAAAGGGSTSTTCSSCIVTLLGSSVLSAVVLGRLEPVRAAADSPDLTPTADSSNNETGVITNHAAQMVEPDNASNAETPATVPPPPSAPLSKTARVLLGIFALPLAALAGGLFMSAGGGMLGTFITLGLFVGIYAIVYDRSGRSLGRGIGIGIAVLLALFAVGAVEMMLWMGLLK